MGVNASREFNFVVPVCLYRKQVFTFTEKFMFNVCQQSHVGNVLTFRSNKFGTKLLFGLVFFFVRSLLCSPLCFGFSEVCARLFTTLTAFIFGI